MATILVVDDDPNIRLGLQQMLAQAGYTVCNATSGKEALALLRNSSFNLVVLDLTLPDMDGLVVCQHIRQLPTYVPLMMLTARDEVSDKVTGLDLGADEYLTKPFEPRELLSRVRAMLRFAEQHQNTAAMDKPEQPVVFGDLQIWIKEHRVEVAGQLVELTSTEWLLLELFATHPGQVFGRETILNKVWGVDYYGDTRTVDTHIKRLRTKIESDPAKPHFIQTIRGFGYRFVTEAELLVRS